MGGVCYLENFSSLTIVRVRLYAFGFIDINDELHFTIQTYMLHILTNTLFLFFQSSRVGGHGIVLSHKSADHL